MRLLHRLKSAWVAFLHPAPEAKAPVLARVPVVGEVWQGNRFGDRVRITRVTDHGVSYLSLANGNPCGTRSIRGFRKNFSPESR